jgi:hypothetical protein
MKNSASHVAGADAAASERTHTEAPNGVNQDGLSTIATVGVVAVATALIEVSLIPGMIIGVAAMAAPKYTQGLGERLRPMMNSAVKGVCRLGMKTREALAEAQEHVSDLVAEARSETTDTAAKGAPDASAATPA